MKPKQGIPIVVFNASVLLAGLNNPNGGSGKLLSYQKSGKINGIVSEIILDEAVRHAEKIRKQQSEVHTAILALFPSIQPYPSKEEVDVYIPLVTDHGDAHLFATAKKTRAQILVSLDKAHVLALKGKIPNLTICSPGDLILFLSH
jgi:putative PIN family toxin of toxin-antitoxin system